MDRWEVGRPGTFLILAFDYTTGNVMKMYTDKWTKLEGDSVIERLSKSYKIHQYSEEPLNTRIKMTAINSGLTMTLDAIWIYK